MPIVPLGQFDKFGVLTDRLPYNLPPNAFSAGRNVRFRDGAVEKINGDRAVYGTPSFPPRYALPVNVDDVILWLYVSLDAAAATAGDTHTVVTREDGGGTDVPYQAIETIPWTGGLLGNVAIINNGIDVPQQWLPAGINDPLQDLNNWPATLRARVLRPFKSHMFALDIEESGTRFPEVLRWSDQTDPGTVPPSWDHTDPTNLAGRTPLTDHSHQLVDALALQDSFIIYKDASVWIAQFVGGKYVFQFRQLFTDIGLLAPRCVTQFRRQHVALSHDDLYVHDGNRWESIIEGRRRREFFNTVDLTKAHNIFLATDYANSEVWVCFPEQGADLANRALVWSWKTGTFGDRDLDNIAHAHWGVVNPQENLAWEDQTETWDNATQTWDVATAENKSFLLQMSADAADPKFLQNLNSVQTFDGATFKSSVERLGLAIAGKNQEGNPVVDMGVVKFIRAVYPRIVVNPTAQLKFYLGVQTEPEGPVTWTPPQTFDPMSENRLHFTIAGRFIAFKIESKANVHWRLEGIDFDIEPMSKF